jgi:hypothetical protein
MRSRSGYRRVAQQPEERIHRPSAREQPFIEQLARNAAQALAIAYCILAPEQREPARKVLDQDGYELPEGDCQ